MQLSACKMTYKPKYTGVYLFLHQHKHLNGLTMIVKELISNLLAELSERINDSADECNVIHYTKTMP